jgi:exonuclease VII small subunit
LTADLTVDLPLGARVREFDSSPLPLEASLSNFESEAELQKYCWPQ